MAHELGGHLGSRLPGVSASAALPRLTGHIKASLLSLGLLLAAGAANADAPPMTTPGQFGVSATGAATYSVPIVVPPGTAGMAPSLSLNYSSQSGNGILGFGWSLGGLPAITRCPQSYAQDGTHIGVNYNSSDRFCLDGQRLLVINGGAYGADGSEYRTEIESFTRVIAHNVTGVSGPGWFEVHTKSGQVIELGNSTDSRILAQGTSVARVWAASKVSDTVGNYMLVSYTSDQGQYYPDHIVYTGNTTAGVSPYNSVFFSYTARNDPSTLYHAGSSISTAKLISDIKTYNNTTGTGTAVTDYKLTYQLGNAPFSQLTSVQRCDGSGACLAPASFTWQTASTWSSRIVVDSEPVIPPPAAGIEGVPTDIDGDGHPDGYVRPAPGLGGCEPLYLTNGTAWTLANMTESYNGVASQAACLVTGYPYGPNSTFVDFDGDGLADMDLFATYPATCFCIVRNDGQGHFAQFGDNNVLAPLIASGINLAAGTDINGDGLPDFFGYNYTTGILSTAINQTTPGHPAFNILTTPVYSNGDVKEAAADAGDVDGDGCSDFRFQGPETNEILLSCRSTTTTIPIPYYLNDPNHVTEIYNGDFNGDGNEDFLVAAAAGAGNSTLNLSTGTSYVVTSVPGLNQNGGNTAQYFVGDLDGDGKTDVIKVDLGHMYVYTWTNGTLVLALTVNINLPQPGCNWNCATGYNGFMWTQDFDGDGCTDLVVDSDTKFFIKFGCHPPLLMTQVSNGIGASTTISYDRLNQNQIYTKCPNNPSSYLCGDTYPTQAVDGPIYVVKEIDTSNGIGGNFVTTYAYAGAKNDLSGRGFLGYQQVIATDQQTHVVQTTSYNIQFPLAGTVLEQTRTLNGVVLSDTVDSYTQIPAAPVMGTPSFVYLHMSTVTGHEVDGTALPSATTLNYNPDAYGNIQNVDVTVSDTSTKKTVNTFSNDPVKWLIGHLTSITVTSTVGSSTITRTSSFQYDPNVGVLTQEVIEPNATGCNGNNTACKLETDYALDAFGHHHVATVSGAGFASRTTTVFYSANGAFATSTQNALGQSDATDFSGAGGAAFGAPTSHTDLNNLQTQWQYDSFGRRTLEIRPGTSGTETAASYQYCTGINGGTASCPQYGAYLVQTTPSAHDGVTQDGPATRTYYDALSRAIAVDVEGFDGPLTACALPNPCWIRVQTAYDGNGFVIKTSRPFFVAGGTAQWTVNSYGPAGNPDPYGRLATVTAPNGGVTSYAYTGLGDAGSRTSVTNALNQTTVTSKNAQGLVASVTNVLGKTTSYVYDSYGNLLTVTDPLGDQIVNFYDLRGNKLSSKDPDLGQWTYTYDGLGEVLTQTDAKGQTTSLTNPDGSAGYDGLGRPTGRAASDQTEGWSYDTASNGIGLIASASGSSAGYGRAYTYDSLSRPSTVTLTASGHNYTYSRLYNSDGRLDTLTYPYGLTVKYVYTQLGYLYQLKDNSSGAVLWTANLRDAELHLTDQLAGNGLDTIQVYDPKTGLVEQIRASADGHDDGNTTNLSYTFDTIGNLTNRSDSYGASETFCYDSLNRLVASLVGGNCSGAPPGGSSLKSVTYDDLGNIALKSDLADQSGGTGAYTYGNAQHQPHAVKSISGTVNGVQNPNFKYDANGNLVCEYTGTNCAGNAITKETDGYWSFNMLHTVSDGATSLTLTYDSEHARITQALTTASTTTTTTYLNDPASGTMAEKVVSGGTVTWNDYLMADGKLVGERTTIVGGLTTTNWFVLDHLGSVAVITGSTGAVVTNGRQSFDPWGRQRNEDGSDDPTGHDPDGPQLGPCGIVCMTGVVYCFGSCPIGPVTGGDGPYGTSNGSISTNSNGEQAQSSGACSTGAGCDSSTGAQLGAPQTESDSSSHIDQVQNTAAGQNAASSSVTSGADDNQNGNGLGKGIHVGYDVVPILDQNQRDQINNEGILPGYQPVGFTLSQPAPEDGVLAQVVYTTWTDINGNQVTSVVDSRGNTREVHPILSEVWGIKKETYHPPGRQVAAASTIRLLCVGPFLPE
jgi:YD repeat-containing protein